MALHLRGLWRHPDFVKLWAGQTVSAFGSMLGALSLTALVFLDATPAQMGLLWAAQGIGTILLAPGAGVWVDRLPRRPILILSDLGRAALLLSVPAAAVFDSLRIEQLYLVAFGAGALDLVFDLAYRAYLPGLVERDHLLEGNAKFQATESVAEVGGPAIGGGLVQAVGGPVAVLLDGLSFLWSAACLSLIRRPEPRIVRSQESSFLAEAREGFSVLWQNRVLRATTLAGGSFRFFGGFIGALYGLYLIRVLGFSPLVMGITIGAGGLGSFVGALFVGPMTRRLGVGPALIASRLLQAGFVFLIPLAGGSMELAFALIFVSQLCGDPFWATYEVINWSLRQATTPERLLGRTTSSIHLVQAGFETLGLVTGGLLAEAIGIRETLWLGAAGLTLGIGWLAFSPIPHLTEVPTQAPADS